MENRHRHSRLPTPAPSTSNLNRFIVVSAGDLHAKPSQAKSESQSEFNVNKNLPRAPLHIRYESKSMGQIEKLKPNQIKERATCDSCGAERDRQKLIKYETRKKLPQPQHAASLSLSFVLSLSRTDCSLLRHLKN